MSNLANEKFVEQYDYKIIAKQEKILEQVCV